MVIQNMKVAPLTKNDQAARKDSICFCHTTQPILTFLRCWGILPITTRHENGSCVFERSWAWSIHSGIVCSFYVYQLIMHVDIEDILATKSLIIFLNHITNAVYALYVLIMLLLAAIKLPQYTRMLNASALVFKHGLFCQTAKRVALLTQYGIVTAFLCLAFSQAAIYYWLFNSETCGSVSDFFFRFSQTTSLLFYAGFFSLIAVVIGGFACFEKLLTSSLNYVPVHPMAGIDETNNQRDFFGVIHYQLCRSEHKALVEFTSMNAAEVVEFLRICHEDMCSCIYSWNCTMDPTFLIYIVLELAIIIIHSYSVVAHLVYTFKHPLAPTIHTLNCVFVFIHVYGLYLFLKNAQRMKNMVRGLTDFLLEYSTRISSLDEHQQVRLFIEKLNNHRPFTASGVFTIDLEIAGPISANILTYVLVALQFEIPEE